MKTVAFRAVALFLLIFSLITWGGAATIAAAWMQPEAADGCCERSGNGESAPSSCSPKECPCFSCLPFTPAEPLAIGHLNMPGFVLLLHPEEVPPPEVILAIDYPPEIC